MKKLIELLKQAINDMIAKNSTISINSNNISEIMLQNLELWEDMYCNNPPWVDENSGVYTLGLPKMICQELKRYILSELKIQVTGESERAEKLDKIINDRMLAKIPTLLDRALAMGGFIIKPYINNNDVYFNFVYPGEFIPISYNDDGIINDIAFIDRYIDGKHRYTRVERHIFENNTITIQNKAYKIKSEGTEDKNELGKEIPLESVNIWKDILPEIHIENVDKPLFAYYKVPMCNNIDVSSSMGISVFSDAVDVIELADKQFSRLNWEYEGGQMAIDVDPTAIKTSKTYYGNVLQQDNYRNRIYRALDLGEDSTYKVFAPSLRDNNYIDGLNKYLAIIEDKIGLARGTLSDSNADARTATEIKILKQRQYITITEHQTALTEVFKNIVNSCNTLCELYEITPQGEYEVSVEWNDSILTDTESELEQKLRLKTENIMSRAEIRAWYLGESIEKAEEEIKKIDKEENESMLNDIFTKNPDTTLE